jgi:hypothetical protein
LDPDDLVVCREDILLPETELMMVVVSVFLVISGR